VKGMKQIKMDDPNLEDVEKKEAPPERESNQW
jgi:hypothetical protein